MQKSPAILSMLYTVETNHTPPSFASSLMPNSKFISQPCPYTKKMVFGSPR